MHVVGKLASCSVWFGWILLIWVCQGFISTEEFASIPELSINPLHTRMGQMFNHVNFKVSTQSCSSVTEDMDLSILHWRSNWFVA